MSAGGLHPHRACTGHRVRGGPGGLAPLRVLVVGMPPDDTRPQKMAHTLAVDIWYILARQTPYADLGVDYFDRRDQDRVRRQAVKRLETLGYQVTLTAVS